MIKKCLGFLVAVILVATFFVPSIVRERTVYITNTAAGAVGTGVIINDHMIMTNHHVVNGGDTFDVKLWNGKTYKAKIVYDAPAPDMAVIKIEDELPIWRQTTITCSTPQILGSSYFTVGQTLGVFEWAYHRIFYGVSALTFPPTKELGVHMSVFTNNSVNHGNSGGGVFDYFGNQIGIVSAGGQIDGYMTNADGKVVRTGLSVSLGEVYVLGTKDLCPILRSHEIKFHQGYGIDDLLDLINRTYNKVYYEVSQL